MNSTELVCRQIRLEYDSDAVNRLVAIPGSTEKARFIIYHHDEGYTKFFLDILPDSIREELLAITDEKLLRDFESVKQILGRQYPCESIWHGRTFTFPSLPSENNCEGVSVQDDRFTILVEGKQAAWAFSARENAEAAELSVETLPDYRRKHYARRTANAWARNVLNSGKTAFFSYVSDNIASEALCKSLGLKPLATVSAYD